jgi:hypothetical protein
MLKILKRRSSKIIRKVMMLTRTGRMMEKTKNRGRDPVRSLLTRSTPRTSYL